MKLEWLKGSELVFWTLFSIQIQIDNCFPVYTKFHEHKDTPQHKTVSDLVRVYIWKHPKCFEHINYATFLTMKLSDAT